VCYVLPGARFDFAGIKIFVPEATIDKQYFSTAYLNRLQSPGHISFKVSLMMSLLAGRNG
jgi:hypothetical protein